MTLLAGAERPLILAQRGPPLPPLRLDAHQSYFQEPHSGGLGWGLPAAMGAQLADPGRLVFATMGDDSYMFANPTACHQVAEVLKLPVIVLVLNNEEWGTVLSAAPDRAIRVAADEGRQVLLNIAITRKGMG